jgi:hypothetical protein
MPTSPGLILNPTMLEVANVLDHVPARHPVYVNAIDKIIRSMKTSMYWAICDVCYFLAAPDSTTSFINIRKPGTNTMTKGANTCTFTPWLGWSTDGATGYLDTNWNFTQAGNNFVQDSAAIVVGHYDAGTNANSQYGWFDGTDGSTLAVRTASSTAIFRVNQALATTTAATVSDARGLWRISRQSSTVTGIAQISINNSIATITQSTNPNQTSTAVNSATLLVGKTATASFATAFCNFLMAGANSPFTANPHQGQIVHQLNKIGAFR